MVSCDRGKGVCQDRKKQTCIHMHSCNVRRIQECNWTTGWTCKHCDAASKRTNQGQAALSVGLETYLVFIFLILLNNSSSWSILQILEDSYHVILQSSPLKLNLPSILNLLYAFLFLVILFAFLWTCSNLSVAFLKYSAQNWTQYSKCGVTNAE